MSFLIVQILGLLAVAALFGGAFVYWLLRRNLVDVSSEYEAYERSLGEIAELRSRSSEADAKIAGLKGEKVQLEKRLAQEAVWRSELHEKLHGLKALSLDPVMGQLAKVGEAVARIRPADLTSVEGKLDSLSGAVDEIRPPDLGQIESKLGTLSKAVESIPTTDLAPVQASLEDVEKRVAGLRNVDLSGVDSRVRSLTEAVNRLEARIEPPPALDLSGVHRRLDAVEKALRERPKPPLPTKPARATKPGAKAARRPSTKVAREPGGNLLRSPSFGRPDDLQKIRGIGPKLEKMLHGIGVYYFWQVADWSAADVRHVDDRQEVFKGRISRDEWVKQAGSLAREPGSARRR